MVFISCLLYTYIIYLHYLHIYQSVLSLWYLKIRFNILIVTVARTECSSFYTLIHVIVWACTQCCFSSGSFKQVKEAIAKISQCIAGKTFSLS